MAGRHRRARHSRNRTDRCGRSGRRRTRGCGRRWRDRRSRRRPDRCGHSRDRGQAICGPHSRRGVPRSPCTATTASGPNAPRRSSKPPAAATSSRHRSRAPTIVPSDRREFVNAQIPNIANSQESGRLAGWELGSWRLHSLVVTRAPQCLTVLAPIRPDQRGRAASAAARHRRRHQRQRSLGRQQSSAHCIRSQPPHPLRTSRHPERSRPRSRSLASAVHVDLRRQPRRSPG